MRLGIILGVISWTLIFGLIYWGLGNAAGIIEANACRATTCKALASDHDGMGQIAESGRFFMQSDEVLSIAEIHDCPSCAKITMRNKRSIFVTGKPNDVACQVWGGTYCLEGKR